MCNQCSTFWDPAAEQAACADTTQEHGRFDSDLHRSRVMFPDGREVTAVSFGSAKPYARERAPDFGLPESSLSEEGCSYGGDTLRNTH